jgi:hypothetical protein
MGSGSDDCIYCHFLTVTVNLNHWGLVSFCFSFCDYCKVRIRVKVTLWLAVYCQSVYLGSKRLETHGHNFFQLNTCGHSPYVTSSLTRGWVCHLQWLLALARAFILRSESHWTHDHILVSQRWDSQPRAQVPIFISPRNRTAHLYPRHWVPSVPPLTTCRAMVEVIRTLLCTLESQSAVPWCINVLRWTE